MKSSKRGIHKPLWQQNIFIFVKPEKGKLLVINDEVEVPPIQQCQQIDQQPQLQEQNENENDNKK